MPSPPPFLPSPSKLIISISVTCLCTQLVHTPLALPSQVAMLPFPLALPPMGRPSVSPPPDPRARTLEHLRAALGVRGDGIIPAYRVGVPSAASAAAAAVPPQLSGGYRASRADLVGNSFVAERDFLVWLLLNNVTICDLGAASRTLLYKGTRDRKSVV